MKKFTISLFSCFLLLATCAGFAVPGFAVGNAPVADNFEILTYRNVPVSGMLSSTDPESDVVYYEITTEPVKGNIALEQNGYFVYTPETGKKGRDYFGYKAIDSQGNISQEATVIIRIVAQKSKTSQISEK